MRRLFIPACLCLVTIGATTTIGSEAAWPIEPIATSAHAKTKTSKARRTAKPAGSGTTATTGSTPPVAEKKPIAAQHSLPAAEKAEEKKPRRTADEHTATQTASAESHSAPGHTAPAPKTASEPAHQSAHETTSKVAHKRVVHPSEREICDTLAESAKINNLPVPFFIRLLFQESKFQPGAVSHAGAQGIAQFMPQTARDIGLDNPFDPLQAIPAAARLLRDFIDQFGNLGLAAAAYNAGPTRVHKWLKKRTRLPAETRGYVKTITGKPANSWKSAKAGHGDTALPQKAPCKAVSARYMVSSATRVPLPPKPPPAATAVRTAHAAKKTAAKHHRTLASAKARARRGGKTALLLAARRRGKKERD